MKMAACSYFFTLFAHVVSDIQGQSAVKAESSSAVVVILIDMKQRLKPRQSGSRHWICYFLKSPPTRRPPALLVGAGSTSARFGTQFVSYDFFLSEVKGTNSHSLVLELLHPADKSAGLYSGIFK